MVNLQIHSLDLTVWSMIAHGHQLKKLKRERDIVAIQKTILAAVPAINCIDPTRMENSEKTSKIVDI